MKNRKNHFTSNILHTFSLFAVSLLPMLLTRELWQEIWFGIRPSAWDGSGHFTLAQIYSDSIFPDTFGWTNAFFAGMPHPNNYPPLFYWFIALLTHSHLFSFLTSFKIVTTLPTFLLPVATWFLAWKISNKNQQTAFFSALSITPLLVDYRFFSATAPLGISYISTFLTGLYSHPLGYLFLIWWYAVYSDRKQSVWRVVFTALLLTGAVLSNFFGAIFAGIFIAVTLIHDLWRLFFLTDAKDRRILRECLIGHSVSPSVAGLLSLFWLMPVFDSREFLITQPSNIPLSEIFSPALAVWYLLAGAGIILWLRNRESTMMGIYLSACVTLTSILMLSGFATPRWFPLNTARMFATLNFLLCVPVGLTFTWLFSRLSSFLGLWQITSQIVNLFSAKLQPRKKIDDSIRPQTYDIKLKSWQSVILFVSLIFGTFLILKVIKPPSFDLAFYQTENREAIDPLLEYAKDHKNGRYLVEIQPFNDPYAGHEARAINNFLPRQGNEVLTVFFREASPSIVFFSPIVDRFSVQADPSGISSVLSDDTDFVNQPAAVHIQQAYRMGVRYLVIRSPWARNLLSEQTGIKSRRDFGLWSIYELNGEASQPAQTLLYQPALVVSNLNLKGRRHNALDFVRFSEEQISSGWFDVLLARSPELKLDKLNVEDGFSALIVDTYDYNDEQAAFARLKEFAQTRQLILLESDNPLFRRMQTQIADFPHAAIINRQPEEAGEWLKPGAPSRSYESSQIRGIWRQIQTLLDRNKIPASDEDNETALSTRIEQNKITLIPDKSFDRTVPVLINMTYHPNWQRTDGAMVYPTTPFFMLTFVHGEPTALNFARRPVDWVGVLVSAATFLLLGGLLLWHYGRRLAIRMKQNSQNAGRVTGESSHNDV